MTFSLLKDCKLFYFLGLCLFSKELITSFSLLLCLVSSGGEGIDIGLTTAHFQQKSEKKHVNLMYLYESIRCSRNALD